MISYIIGENTFCQSLVFLYRFLYKWSITQSKSGVNLIMIYALLLRLSQMSACSTRFGPKCQQSGWQVRWSAFNRNDINQGIKVKGRGHTMTWDGAGEAGRYRRRDANAL